MTRKSFFRERSAEQIMDMRVRPVSSQRNLVRIIDNIDPVEDAVELRVRITPGRFFINVANGAEASRKCYKHGDLLALEQPHTQEEAYTCSDIPLAIRKKTFDSIKGIREEEINFVGLSWYPVQGTDKRKRVDHFVWMPESVRVFAYAENMAGGIEIEPKYTDSERVKKEGGTVLCRVPSRTKKKSRYRVKLLHVPVEGVTERRAVAWGIKPQYVTGEEPEHSFFSIRYTWEDAREGSDRVVFYPFERAAYIAIIKHYLAQHNMTPLEMSPFALISRYLAGFYKKLCNNVVVFDPSLSKKKQLRKPHLDEKSILIGRSIHVHGHDETAYWDPARDGRLRDYDWSIPE